MQEWGVVEVFDALGYYRTDDKDGCGLSKRERGIVVVVGGGHVWFLLALGGFLTVLTKLCSSMPVGDCTGLVCSDWLASLMY